MKYMSIILLPVVYLTILTTITAFMLNFCKMQYSVIKNELQGMYRYDTKTDLYI